MEVGALEEMESKKDGAASAACSVHLIVCVSICAEEEEYEGWRWGWGWRDCRNRI